LLCNNFTALESNIKKIFYLFILSICCSFYSFSATTYYVATNGSDASTGTSLATPFATIAKAISKVVAGDTIYVRSGTYVTNTRINISKVGTSLANYTLSAYKPDLIAAYPADGRPVIDFSAMAVGSSNQGFSLSGANYWKVYGLRVKGAGDNGMLLETCSYTTIEFCDFFRSRDTGLQIRSSSHHCLVLNCDSYENADLGTGTTTLGGNADGFAPKLDIGDSVIFRGCRAWMNSDDGWDGYLKAFESGLPDGMTTILENCWSFRNGYYWLDGSTTSSENGNGIKMGGSANKDQAHNFTVVKCLSFLNKAKGFDQNNNAGSISLYNCSAYKNGDFDYGLNSSGVTYASGALTTVKNSVSLGTKGTTFRSGSVLVTNGFSTSTTSANYASLDTTGVTAHRKIDGSLPDISLMTLQTSPKSAYIDAGTVLSTIPYYGTAGVPYIGAGPDLGYVESNYVLPVSLLSFNASLKNNTVVLNWQTATEINNKGWNIEKIQANANPVNTWQNIGFVAGNNSSNNSNYYFTDKAISVGNIYQYRLQQIDFDGTVNYSYVVTIKFSGKNVVDIIAYPNPVQSSVNIRFEVTKKANVNVSIYNTIGQLTTTLVNENIDAGIYIRPFNASSLKSGNYIIKLQVNDETTTTKLVKQ
jgi:hypothetical protein